ARAVLDLGIGKERSEPLAIPPEIDEQEFLLAGAGNTGNRHVHLVAQVAERTRRSDALVGACCLGVQLAQLVIGWDHGAPNGQQDMGDRQCGHGGFPLCRGGNTHPDDGTTEISRSTRTFLGRYDAPTYSAKCWPVSVDGDATRSAGVPSKTIRPPSWPAPGP